MANDMRIRRFEAPDSKTALAMVKAELGDDAVILANRTISVGGGAARPYGYGRTMVEVVAAMDYDLYTIADSSEAGTEQPAAIVPVTAEEKSQTADKGGVSGEAKKTAGMEPAALEARRSTLLSRLKKQGIGLGSGRPNQPIGAESRAGRAALRLGDSGRQPRRRMEGSRPLAEDVARWREQLINRIQYNSIFDLKENKQRVIALVGATGVGKTTTVAKIAACARLHMGLKVGLISMDCYRIGATDQLRTYGRIMHIPCEVALREKDLRRIVAMHADCDLILVDTAGKSPYDEGHVGELRRWFAGVSPQVEAYLTISATTKKEDLKTVFEKYRQMSIAGLVLTKLDETRAYASLCQQLAAGGIPVSCLGTGQRVPEDFAQASKAAIGVLFREGWRAFMGRCASDPATLLRSLAV